MSARIMGDEMYVVDEMEEERESWCENEDEELVAPFDESCELRIGDME